MLAFPAYLLLSPKLTTAPKQIQEVQRSIKEIDFVSGISALSIPKTSSIDSFLKYSKEMVTILSSTVGLILGARELRKEKRRRSSAVKEPVKKVLPVRKKVASK